MELHTHKTNQKTQSLWQLLVVLCQQRSPQLERWTQRIARTTAGNLVNELRWVLTAPSLTVADSSSLLSWKSYHCEGAGQAGSLRGHDFLGSCLLSCVSIDANMPLSS